MNKHIFIVRSSKVFQSPTVNSATLLSAMFLFSVFVLFIIYANALGRSAALNKHKW